MSRASFLARVLLNYGTDRKCPYCGSTQTHLIGRKNYVLELRHCDQCSLRYRWPKETEAFQNKFYQTRYKETAMTTELPEPALLAQLKATNFAGSPRDFSSQLAVLKHLHPGGRALDYGTSWGYGVFQLAKAGYDAFGFEISKPRAAAGREQLGVAILDELSDLANIPSQSLDVIFASHVLEHLPSPRESFNFFARTLRPGGVVMVLVPNSGGQKARNLGTGWGTMINEKHTLALTRDFFEKNLPPFGFEVVTLSHPYIPEQVESAFTDGNVLPAETEELMVVARRTQS